MARMIRKQVYIEPQQDAALKRRARELGVTEAELIRSALDQATLMPAIRPDLAAWEEIKLFVERLPRPTGAGTDRGWTREELYEERLERYSR